MNCLSLLIEEAGIQLSPQCYFFDHFADALFFLLGLRLALGFMVIVFLFLFLLELLEPASHLPPEAQLKVRLSVGGAESCLMNFLLVFLLAEEVCFAQVGGNGEAKDIDFSGLVVVAHGRIEVVIEVLLFESPDDLVQADLLIAVLLDCYLH